MMLSNTTSIVMVGKDLSKPFTTKWCFRQDNPSSCDLLYFLLRGFWEKVESFAMLLVYSNDIDIIEHIKRDVTAAFSTIAHESII